MSDLILKHYGHSPDIQFDPSRVYGESHRFDKPNGFWVSVQGPDDWKEWCEAEEFALGTLANEHDVLLSESANILHLDSLEALHRFADEWALEGSTGRWGIHWDLLTDHYDGIIIAPYQWQARLSDRTPWYYSWDVASGCIWNLNAIESVRPVDMAEEVSDVQHRAA